MLYGDWYMLYDGWYRLYVGWYMLYDVLIYALWCFDICYMMISVWLIYVWYMIWHMFWYIYFDDVVICTPVNGCKYHNELCYKAPLYGMGVMLLCYHVVMSSWCYDVIWFFLSKMIIVNIVMRCVIKLHYVVRCHVIMMLCLEQIFHCEYCIELGYKAPWAICLLSAGCWGICVIKHRGRCSPKGKGFVTALVKILCKNI